MTNSSRASRLGVGLAAGLVLGLNAIAEAERQRTRGSASAVPIGLPPRRSEVQEYFDDAWDRIGGEVNTRYGFDEPYSSDLGEIGQLFRFMDREGNRVIAYKADFMNTAVLTFKDVGLNGGVYGNRTALRNMERGIRNVRDPLSLHDVRELLEVSPLRLAQRNRW